MKNHSHYRLFVASLALLALLAFVPGAAWAAPAPAPVGRPEEQGQTVCSVVTDSLNLRTGPSTRYRALRALPWGTQLQLLGDAPSPVNPVYRWLRVRVLRTGQQGWVSADPQYVQCGVSTPTSWPSQGLGLGPVQSVYAYYDWINQRRYQDTWLALSPAFRAIKNKNNFSEYQAFWNTVSRVDVVNAWLVSGSPMSEATVQASLRYTYKSGRVATDSCFMLDLIWDYDSGGWLIDKTVDC